MAASTSPTLFSPPSTPLMERSIATHRGTLEIYIGPMFSGKTTRLNGELTNFAVKRFRTLKIIHCDDRRSDVASSDDRGSTHNPSYVSLYHKIDCIRTDKLSSVDVSEYHVIGIDESQFYPDLLVMVEKWVEQDGKHVRVAGLDGDANKRKFGQTLDLIPMCDNIIKLSATCVPCLHELQQNNFHGNILAMLGPFTKRLTESTEQKDIGGSDKYIAVCRYHHSC